MKASEKEAKPTSKSTVEEIKRYLTSKGIDFSGKTLKSDLLALAGVEEV
ncbi:TPA: hypothetical protein ACJPB4_001608 [Streptococcus pyogenes]|nr:hypothetical protein [Streptococcus pyogenes]HER4685828.1 hypothetical protein [Streptococcus pyogenes NGAS353]HER4760324.1 hypothetical protein [Streptococcus pyogenes NGAS245]ESU85941.1 hypothetical protein HMPREF1242_1018 [Streptococcus pyogenes GA40884]MCF1202134.1 hypothetical protein [Streptococcus pyogenes]HEP1349640.1 hypothetical protein [Streptococcus pyogenes]